MGVLPVPARGWGARRASALRGSLQHQHHFAVLFQPHGLRFHVLKNKPQSSAQHPPCPLPPFQAPLPTPPSFQTPSPTRTLSPSPTLFNTHHVDLPLIPPLLIPQPEPLLCSIPPRPPSMDPTLHHTAPSHPSPPPLGSPPAPMVSRTDRLEFTGSQNLISVLWASSHPPGWAPRSSHHLQASPSPRSCPSQALSGPSPAPHFSREPSLPPALPTPRHSTLMIRLKSCLSTRRK